MSRSAALAFLELTLLAVPAALVGVHIVLRRLVFASHAVGIAAFPGVVLGSVVISGLGLAGGFASSIVAVLAIAGLRAARVESGAATAVVLAAALATGSLLVGEAAPGRADPRGILFGSLVAISPSDIVAAGAVATASILLVAGTSRRLLVDAFDQLPGAPGRGRLDLALLVLMAVATVVAVRAVGALLATILMVAPAAAAALRHERITRVYAVAFALACAAGAGGIAVARAFDVPPGPAVAGLAAGALLLAASRVSGLVLATGASLALAVGPAAVLATHAPAPSRPVIVATTPIVGDWTRTLVGGRLSVIVLVPATADVHDFEPRPSDGERVRGARLVVASGGGMDDWISDVARDAGGDASFVSLAPPGAGAHFFHDPRLAARAITALADALVAADPAGADAYRARASAYIDRLADLDRDLAARFAAIPAGRRFLISDHDEFAALAERYGLRHAAVFPSAVEGVEPSVADVAALVRRIRSSGVRAVFVDATRDPRAVAAIAAQADARVISGLRGDSLGTGPASTYLGMLRGNGSLIAEGLGG